MKKLWNRIARWFKRTPAPSPPPVTRSTIWQPTREGALMRFAALVPARGEWILGVGGDKVFAYELAAVIGRPSVVEENEPWNGEPTYVVRSPGQPWRKAQRKSA